VNDPIVDEVRKVRDAHAARFNFDLDAIFQDIKEQEKRSGHKFVSFPPRKLEPNQAEAVGTTTVAAVAEISTSTPSETWPRA